MLNSFSIIAIIGLVFIILGNITIYREKRIRRKFTYPLLIIGGIFLLIYSISINNLIFSVLQGFFILASIYGLLKIHQRIKSGKKKK